LQSEQSKQRAKRSCKREGGFGPEDVSFSTPFSMLRGGKSNVGLVPMNNARRRSLRLARIIVTLGKYHLDYVTAELQARSIEVFDLWPPSGQPL
jgi:hypothetical protein